ncbi:MAG: dephospho-CoA kinase [Hydrotalea sp.]|nr:dephospho-CoA kinase [Hydrotalea sp.]
MVEKKLQIIGLTGSIATGKSAVAAILTARGFHVLDADDAAKQLSAVGGAAHDEIATRFPMALRDDKTIDRKKLAAVVFADKEKLTQLEKILHPKIKNLRDEFYAAARQRGDKVIFIMVPLLFEKAIDQECDKTWVVTSTPAVQSERALHRPGMTPELLDKIRASQMPDAEKIKRADVVIENNGTLDDLKQKIDSAIKTL